MAGVELRFVEKIVVLVCLRIQEAFSSQLSGMPPVQGSIFGICSDGKSRVSVSHPDQQIEAWRIFGLKLTAILS
ncbi:MAG: hypothetical protein V7703_11435 [Hyphomicrobiales bacterium]